MSLINRAGALLALVALLAVSLPAQAITQLQFKSFTNTGSLGPSLQSTVFDPFDTSLGTLDEVHLNLNGFLQVTGTLPANPVGPFGSPIPYSYGITVQQSLFGLGGFSNFGFGSPASFIYRGTASGAGEAFLHQTPFNWSVRFDEITDLFGFAIPSGIVATVPPVTVTGLREDFHEDLVTGITGLMLDNLLVTTTFSGAQTVVPNVTMFNLATLTYEYTPFPEEIPEPATLLLFAIGVLAMLSVCRRARTPAPAQRRRV